MRTQEKPPGLEETSIPEVSGEINGFTTQSTPATDSQGNDSQGNGHASAIASDLSAAIQTLSV
jgi:hypothetical protein